MGLDAAKASEDLLSSHVLGGMRYLRSVLGTDPLNRFLLETAE